MKNIQNNPSVTIGIFLLVFLVVGYHYVITPLLQSEKGTHESIKCRENLRLLSLALLEYSENSDDKFPPANHWIDCIDNNKYLPNVDRAAVFHCPAAEGSYGYAMNKSVGSVSLMTFNLQDTVLLFETDSENRNANGSLKDLALKRHHTLNCSFCAGEVHWVNPYTKIIWVWTVTNVNTREQRK